MGGGITSERKSLVRDSFIRLFCRLISQERPSSPLDGGGRGWGWRRLSLMSNRPGQRQSLNPLIAVIADDLTGVCDTGAQFASAGLRTIGSVSQEFKSETVPQVLLVNTQSRSLEGREASLVIQQTAAGLKRFEPKWFFKKIDTALRGNIAIEVLSMMEALGVRTVLYAASIPGAGRTTVNGCQFFRGVPIKESIHGEDRLNPPSKNSSASARNIFSPRWTTPARAKPRAMRPNARRSGRKGAYHRIIRSRG